MVARQDLKKKHHGRRKKGSRKRHKAWLKRNNLRVKNPRNQSARKRIAKRKANWLRKRFKQS